MADEASILARWAYTTLSTDSTILAAVSTRIYDGVAVQGGDEAHIVLNIIPIPDYRTIGRRVWAWFLMDVKVVSKAVGFATYAAATSQIDTLLHDKFEVAVTGGIIKSSTREQPIHYVESNQNTGINYRHQGNSFRVAVEAN
jgi:hypothetical protein